VLNSSKLLFLSIGVLLAILISSCTYDKTVVTLGSAFDNTWSFSNGSGYDFDANYVEIKNGKAQLKELDLEHSDADFNNGTHVGSHVFSDNITLLEKPNASIAHVNSILPTQSGNLAGYWRFDGDYFDSSGNSRDLTPVGTPTMNSIRKLGTNSVSFNGTNDALEPAGSFINGDNLSLSVWVKKNAIAADMTLISIGPTSGCSPSSTLFRINNANVPTISVGCGTFVSSSTAINDNEWTHLVMTKSGTGFGKIYINGVLAAGPTDINNGQTVNSTDDLYIARYFSAGSDTFYFSGNLDEMAIWNSTLSDSEVLNLYELQNANFTELASSWTPKWDNIVGYWKMDGNWQDSSGNGYKLNVLGDPDFSLEEQVGSHSGNFDGEGDASEGGIASGPLRTLNLADDISLAFWVRADPNQTEVGLTSNRIAIVDATQGYLAQINYANQTSVNHGKIQVCRFNQTSPVCLLSASYYLDNIYHHVTFTKSNSELRLYIDGKLEAIGTDIAAVSTNVDRISFSNITSDLAGSIDDFAIWSSSLSLTEVKQLYSRQKQKYAGSYDSEVIDLGSTTSNWPNLSWSTNLPFGKELIGDFDNDGNPDSESSSDYFGLSGDLSNGLIGYWPLNEKSQTVGSDNDFKNLGSDAPDFELFGTATLGTLGKFNNSIYFDGSNSYLEADDSLIVTDRVFSISFWMKFEPHHEDPYFHLISNEFWDGSPASRGWSLYRHSNTKFLGVGGYTSAQYFNVVTASEVFDGGWKHIVAIYSNGSLNLYVNGIQDVNFPIAYNIGDGHEIDGTFYLGGSPVANRNFKGFIDEVSIWSRALNDEEVQQLYRRGANRIKIQVKSCVDSSCICKSYNPAPLGNETDCDGDGILNAADNDDIHKSEFIGPGGDGTTYYSELFNRPTTEITFDCALNTTDSNPGVCVGDEITLAGGPKPTGPEFLQTDYTQFVSPSANQYAQYRVYMEADDNTACDGEPCLPELTSVNLNPSGITKYSGGLREVRPKAPITFNQLRNINITADACVTFRLARSGTYYYHDGSAWSPATIAAHRSTESELENNILQFGSQFGPGELEVIAYLETDSDQLTPCGVDEIDVNYK